MTINGETVQLVSISDATPQDAHKFIQLQSKDDGNMFLYDVDEGE